VENNPEQAESCVSPANRIDAFVAMDLRTGAIKWSRRLQGFDAWTFVCNFVPPGVTWCPSPMGPDYDFGQGAMLFSVKINGRKRDLLAAGQKSGVVWALDPDTGDVVWSRLVGPGGALGGIMWGSATDGERIYVANSNWEHKPHTLVSGQQISGGSWSALDAATGAILWQTADPQGASDMGAVTVANGVVYAGSMDPQGHVYAMDARTGSVLWNYAAGGSVNAGAAVVGGTVFWGSGYSRGNMGTASGKLHAFSVGR
jgi:polyvinyl alcohol dehydrogenase (cytochrome)